MGLLEGAAFELLDLEVSIQVLRHTLGHFSEGVGTVLAHRSLGVPRLAAIALRPSHFATGVDTGTKAPSSLRTMCSPESITAAVPALVTTLRSSG